MSGWQSWTKRQQELGEAEKSGAHCPQAPCFPPAGTGAARAPRRVLGEELYCVVFPNTLQWARTPPRAPAEPHSQLGRVSGDSRAGGPQTTRDAAPLMSASRRLCCATVWEGPRER